MCSISDSSGTLAVTGQSSSSTTVQHHPSVQSGTTSSPAGVPVFIEDLDAVYYVVRGRAVTLACAASPAVHIGVQCAGHWLEPSRHVSEEVLDSQSGLEYLRTSVNVSKEDVETLLPAGRAARVDYFSNRLIHANNRLFIITCGWLGGLVVRSRTSDSEVVSLSPTRTSVE